MPLRPNLLAEIQSTLGGAVIPSLTTRSATSDLYEGYLFAIILRAARIEGATVKLQAVNGPLPNPFIFRTSPGYLNSRRKNYGYAEISFPRCPVLEAHVSVRVAGHSNVLHECDVSVIEQSEADLCRRAPDRFAPRSSRVLIAVEAKYYTTDVPLLLGRGFLGLVRDLSAHNAFFVFNRDSDSIERLLAHKKQQWEHKVEPINNIPVNRLKNAFQTVFRDFLARTRA